MKNYSRRDLGLLLPALAAAVPGRAQNTEPKAPPMKLASKAYVFDNLPVKKNGENVSRAVLNGATHKDDPVELHITELAAGGQPHPPHRHAHEEILMLQSGQLDCIMNGETIHLTPGSVVYVASNDLHGWKNPGTQPAQYFVISLSGDGA